jgi:hypothetical protein
MGWGGLRNGDLLANAEVDFDIFITGDRNLTSQQQISQFNITVVVLHAPSIQLHDTLPLMSKLSTIMSTLRPGEIVDLIS